MPKTKTPTKILYCTTFNTRLYMAFVAYNVYAEIYDMYFVLSVLPKLFFFFFFFFFFFSLPT